MLRRFDASGLEPFKEKEEGTSRTTLESEPRASQWTAAF